MKNTIQQFVNNYGFGITVEKLVSEIYWKLRAAGFNPCIVNERYIEVDGTTYQLRKTRSEGHWTVVSF